MKNNSKSQLRIPGLFLSVLLSLLPLTIPARLSAATPGVHYVDRNGSNAVPPFLSWATAATNIQGVVDAAQAGDTVVVGPRIYDTGGRPGIGLEMTNRAAVDRAVVLQTTPPLYYFRISPVTPWAMGCFAKLAIQPRISQGAAVAAFRPAQAAEFFSALQEVRRAGQEFLEFEQVPPNAYLNAESYLQSASQQTTPPEFGPPVAKVQRTIIATDQNTYANLGMELERWAFDVRLCISNVTISTYVFSGTDLASPENLRSRLTQLHDQEGVNGVILVGLSIPVAQFKLPWGEVASLPLFYEDLDGVFADSDADGCYDWHDWGSNVGNEMWTAWVRPPELDSMAYLRRYLDKLHNYYARGRGPARGLLTLHSDWCDACSVLSAAFDKSYPGQWDYLGVSPTNVSVLLTPGSRNLSTGGRMGAC